MPNILPFVTKSLRPCFSAIKQNKEYLKDPDYFKPYGIQAFFGEQGSGKTITLIHFYQKLAKRYPKAIVVSNIVLHNRKQLRFDGNSEKFKELLKRGIDPVSEYIFYSSKEEYAIVNKYIRNGKYGVILLTDEYQNYFSNQDSRNVPTWVIEQAAQNRKQRRIHLVSSQDYDQIAKPTRRRSDIAFKCRTYSLPFSKGPIFTVYWAYDAKRLDFDNSGRQTGAKPLKMGWFFQSAKLRNSFDTFQVVFTGDQSDGVFRSSENTITLRESSLPIKRKRRFGFKRR